MYPNLNQIFAQHSYKFKIKARTARQKLPFKMVKINGTEWTIGGSYEKGKIDLAIALNYPDSASTGVWAGLFCEMYDLANGGAVLKSGKTKLHFIRTGHIMEIGMRIWPARLFRRSTPLHVRASTIPKIWYGYRYTITTFRNTFKAEVATLLALTDTHIARTPWPKPNDQCFKPVNFDFTLMFANGKRVLVNRATLLSKLEKRSPVCVRITSYPNILWAVVPLNPESRECTLFFDYVATGYIPPDGVNEKTIYPLLQLVQYFQCGALLDLCAVRLIHLMRAGKLPGSLKTLLVMLGMTLITDIIRYDYLSTCVEPQLSETDDDTDSDNDSEDDEMV